jgi:hypothetical protein
MQVLHLEIQFDDRMQALIAVRLRLLDIVTHLNHGHVLLAGDHVEDLVGVRDEAACDTYARDVITSSIPNLHDSMKLVKSSRNVRSFATTEIQDPAPTPRSTSRKIR